MRIGVPSGIGDISWVVSKLINSPQWNEIEFMIADGWPYRASPYLKDMLGKKTEYGEFQYDTIVSFECINRYRTWQDVVKKGAGIFYLQPNHHLEKGRPLRDWLPDLDTDYHYPLTLPDVEGKRYCDELSKKGGPWIGVSAASYRGHKAWKTWDIETWRKLLDELVASGFRICFMGGSWDDLTRGLAGEMSINHKSKVIDIVGQTTFPEACAVHNLLPFFIGFSSGIGIIRTVMSLPTMMLWPEHQVALSESWADPEDIRSGRYVPAQYIDHSIIKHIFLSHAKSWGA